MAKGRGEENLVPFHRALGSLAEGHCREADLPVLFNYERVLPDSQN